MSAAPEENLDALEQEVAALEAKGKSPLSGEDRSRLNELQRTIRRLKGEPELTAWERVQLARHADRPHALDYIKALFVDFEELHGDRLFADDPAIVAGFAKFHDRPCAVIGQQKGRDTKQKLHRNFGMPKPEGYRKALRVMQLAAKFGRPVFTLLDTPGAYPGIDAEERGQAEAIARNLYAMAELPVPIITACIGEGGSGGALALGVSNRVLMMENSVYSVISPESCAAIVWRDSGKAEVAAKALRPTAMDLLEFGIVDEMVREPAGGAHAAPDTAMQHLEAALERHIAELEQLDAEELIEQRYAKYRTMAPFIEEVEA